MTSSPRLPKENRNWRLHISVDFGQPTIRRLLKEDSDQSVGSSGRSMANLPHEYTESWLWGYSVSGLQGLRLGIGRVAIDGRGKAQEFFFETDPTPSRYTAPRERRAPVIIRLDALGGPIKAESWTNCAELFGI